MPILTAICILVLASPLPPLVSIPMELICILAFFSLLSFPELRAYWRVKRDRCVHCGYRRGGLDHDARCPECGNLP